MGRYEDNMNCILIQNVHIVHTHFRQMFWNTSLLQCIHQANNVIVCVFLITQSIEHDKSCCISVPNFAVSYQLPDPL